MILGHEPVGIVAEVGAEVTGVRPGDRIGTYWTAFCGECEHCRAGNEGDCVPATPEALGVVGANGGYAEYQVMKAERAIPLPDGIDFTDAAPLFCAGLTVYRGLKDGGVRPGQRVGVVGIGGLGHLAIPIAKAMGAEVIAISGSPDKEALARDLGADHFVLNGPEAAQQLLSIGGAEVVLSTASSTQPLLPLLMGLQGGATIVLNGLTEEPIAIPNNAFIFLQLRIVGSNLSAAPRAELRELLALAVEHGIRPVTEVYPLAEVNAVLDRMRANEVRLRAVVTP